VPEFPRHAFQRQDAAADGQFYRAPRFVTHIDNTAIRAVTAYYRTYFPPGAALLDLMSSWVSHLPDDVRYDRVVGLGLNAAELAANPRLTDSVVHDLNQHPTLPFGTAEFDGAAICVSVQYLTQPVAVFREIGRVVRAGGPLVVTFSNRCFPTKAVSLWHALDDAGHMRLVQQYFTEAGNWGDSESYGPRTRSHVDPLFAVIGRSRGEHHAGG